MTPAEHYAEAERLLAAVANVDVIRHLDAEYTQAIVAVAQAHATLALTAVQADHTAVVAAGSITVRGVVDVPAVVRRMAFAKGAGA